RLLVRAALRLQAAWLRAAQAGTCDTQQHAERCARRQRGLQATLERLRKATCGRLSAVQALLHRELSARLQELRDCLGHWQADLGRPAPQVPALRTLLDELREIEADFADLSIDWQARAVSAGTEPVTLGGVEL